MKRCGLAVYLITALVRQIARDVRECSNRTPEHETLFGPTTTGVTTQFLDTWRRNHEAPQ